MSYTFIYLPEPSKVMVEDYLGQVEMLTSTEITAKLNDFDQRAVTIITPKVYSANPALARFGITPKYEDTDGPDDGHNRDALQIRNMDVAITTDDVLILYGDSTRDVPFIERLLIMLEKHRGLKDVKVTELFNIFASKA